MENFTDFGLCYLKLNTCDIHNWGRVNFWTKVWDTICTRFYKVAPSGKRMFVTPSISYCAEPISPTLNVRSCAEHAIYFVPSACKSVPDSKLPAFAWLVVMLDIHLHECLIICWLLKFWNVEVVGMWELCCFLCKYNVSLVHVGNVCTSVLFHVLFLW